MILIFTETQNSLQNFSGLSAAESAAYEEKNPLSQRKELWIFWYGDKPEELFKRLVSPELKDVPDISGTWEMFYRMRQERCYIKRSTTL